LLRLDKIMSFNNCAIVFHGASSAVAPATWWADCTRELRRDKDKFESLIPETQNKPPDTIVLAETDLSFMYTPDSIEAAGWKMYTVCGPFKSGSPADANTGRVSLLVLAPSVKVKTNILMKNNSHQLVHRALQLGQRIYTIPVHHRSVLSTNGQDSHKQDSECFQTSKRQLCPSHGAELFYCVLFNVPVCYWGLFDAYTGEVQPRIGTDIYFVELETPDTSRGIASPNREQRRNRSNEGTYHLASQ
jgi:hypothetical protein